MRELIEGMVSHPDDRASIEATFALQRHDLRQAYHGNIADDFPDWCRRSGLGYPIKYPNDEFLADQMQGSLIQKQLETAAAVKEVIAKSTNVVVMPITVNIPILDGSMTTPNDSDESNATGEPMDASDTSKASKSS